MRYIELKNLGHFNLQSTPRKEGSARGEGWDKRFGRASGTHTLLFPSTVASAFFNVCNFTCIRCELVAIYSQS